MSSSSIRRMPSRVSHRTLLASEDGTLSPSISPGGIAETEEEEQVSIGRDNVDDANEYEHVTMEEEPTNHRGNDNNTDYDNQDDDEEEDDNDDEDDGDIFCTPPEVLETEAEMNMFFSVPPEETSPYFKTIMANFEQNSLLKNGRKVIQEDLMKDLRNYVNELEMDNWKFEKQSWRV